VISCLVIPYGGGDGRGFNIRFLGNMARLLQCLHHAYIREVLGETSKSSSLDQNYNYVCCFEKRWPGRLLYPTIFNRVLDIIRIKIRHLKGENKWESSRRPGSNGLERYIP